MSGMMECKVGDVVGCFDLELKQRSGKRRNWSAPLLLPVA